MDFIVSLLNQIKRSVMDVRCTTKCGTIFIVEMQNHAATEFLKRSQYYASHTYVNQLSPSQTHEDLKPIAECKTLQDQWIHLFKCAKDELDIPFSTPIMQGIYTQLEESRWTRDELDQYLKIKMYEVSLRRAEQDKFEEGRKEGVEEGMEKGRIDTTVEMARAMHQAGIAMDVITKVTGLTLDGFSHI